MRSIKESIESTRCHSVTLAVIKAEGCEERLVSRKEANKTERKRTKVSKTHKKKVKKKAPLTKITTHPQA
jgi:hypothetical protein